MKDYPISVIKLNEAIQALQNGQIKKSIMIYEELLKSKVDDIIDDSMIYVNLGLAYHYDSRPNEAIDCFYKVIGNSSNQSVENQVLSMAYTNLGVVFESFGESFYDTALQNYQKAIQAFPENVLPQKYSKQLIKAKKAQQPFLDARAELQMINNKLDSDPQNPELWFRKARIFQKALAKNLPKKLLLETTLLWYKQALREWDLLWQVYLDMGRILIQLNRYEESILTVSKSIILNSKNEKTWDLLEKILLNVGLKNQVIRNITNMIQNELKQKKDLFDFDEIEEKLRRFLENRDMYETSQVHTKDISNFLDLETDGFAEDFGAELESFNFEVCELISLGLFDIAENFCIQFELIKGKNDITNSALLKIKESKNSLLEPKIKLQNSFKENLLNIAHSIHRSNYQVILNYLYKNQKFLKTINPLVINEIDDHIRGQLENIQKLRISNEMILSEKLDTDVIKLWNMAFLNFILATKMNHPLFITYSATTLAEIYLILGRKSLSVHLYRISAVNADLFHNGDYYVDALGKCALIFMEQEKYGLALDHLLKARKHEENTKMMNKFRLYETLGKVYEKLSFYEESKSFYKMAVKVPGVPDNIKENAKLCSSDTKIRLEEHLQPTVITTTLDLKTHKIATNMGNKNYHYTSKHELYDTLLQHYNQMLRIGETITDRKSRLKYKTIIDSHLNSLIEVALDLGLNKYALNHLESQKSVLLNNRLKYLLRDKPKDISPDIWEKLQKLIELYRNSVEINEIDDKSNTTLYFSDQIIDAIEALLSRSNLLSKSSTIKTKYKFAFIDDEEEFEIKDSKSLIIEYYCGPNTGACFLMSPYLQTSPTVVKLPLATISNCEKLSGTFNKILKQFMKGEIDYHQSNNKLDAFLKELDNSLFLPIKEFFENPLFENICIIPHRILHVLPLNLLGLSVSYENSIIHKFPISFAPSAVSNAM